MKKKSSMRNQLPYTLEVNGIAFIRVYKSKLPCLSSLEIGQSMTGSDVREKNQFPLEEKRFFTVWKMLLIQSSSSRWCIIEFRFYCKWTRLWKRQIEARREKKSNSSLLLLQWEQKSRKLWKYVILLLLNLIIQIDRHNVVSSTLIRLLRYF